MVCWKLSTKENERESHTCINSAHNGWIWDLAAIDNTVYSCSWDHNVKAWTLTSTGLIHFKTYKMYMSWLFSLFSLWEGRARKARTFFYSFLNNLSNELYSTKRILNSKYNFL